MGYNLQTRCLTHGESAYVSRGQEVPAIRLWMRRHRSRDCVVEWAVDSTYSTPSWAEDEQTFYLPDDFLSEAGPRPLEAARDRRSA